MIHHRANKLLKLTVAGLPGACLERQIRSRAILPKLPLGGASYTTTTIVRSALCLTESHGQDRARLMQQQVVAPAFAEYINAEHHK